MHWYLGLIYEPEHVLKADNNSNTSTASEVAEGDSAEAAMGNAEEGATPSDTHSEVEVEANLTTLTKACSLEEIAVDPQPHMEVDATAPPPHVLQHPSPTLSYADPTESVQERGKPVTARPISPMCISPEIEVMDVQPSGPPSPVPPLPPTEMPADEDNVPADELNLFSDSNEISPANFYGTGTSTRQNKKQGMKYGRKGQSDKPVEIPKPQPDT
jgi:hypothetical protein